MSQGSEARAQSLAGLEAQEKAAAGSLMSAANKRPRLPPSQHRPPAGPGSLLLPLGLHPLQQQGQGMAGGRGWSQGGGPGVGPGVPSGGGWWQGQQLGPPAYSGPQAAAAVAGGGVGGMGYGPGQGLQQIATAAAAAAGGGGGGGGASGVAGNGLVNADVSNVVSDVLKDGFIEQLCSLMMIVAHEQLDQAAAKVAAGGGGDASISGKEAPDQDGKGPGAEGVEEAAKQQQQQDGGAGAGVAPMEVDGGTEGGGGGGGVKRGSSRGGSSSSGAGQGEGAGGVEGDAAAAGGGGLAPELQAAAEAAVLVELDLVLQKLVHAVSRKVSLGPLGEGVAWEWCLRPGGVLIGPQILGRSST